MLHTRLFFSFQKKFFLVWTDRQFAKDTHACCFNNYTTTIFFIFFLAGTIDSLNRTRGKQNLHDWYVCFHVVVIINIEKSCRDLSHTRGKLYACTRRFGLCFMSRTNKAVATRWLATTTTTTKSCDQHLLYYHPTILFSPFPRAYKAKLISLPWDMMMQLKILGGYVVLRFVEIDCIIVKKKMRWWLGLACWHFACYLAGKK